MDDDDGGEGDGEGEELKPLRSCAKKLGAPEEEEGEEEEEEEGEEEEACFLFLFTLFILVWIFARAGGLEEELLLEPIKLLLFIAMRWCAARELTTRASA